MNTIRFDRFANLVAFSSMAEGMSEVQADNGDTAAAESLDRLIAAVGIRFTQGAPFECEIEARDVEQAIAVVANLEGDADDLPPFDEADADEQADNVWEGEIVIDASTPGSPSQQQAAADSLAGAIFGR